MVHNSKELDVQRKLFLESMSLSVSIVKPRTSSHQAISEILDELQVCRFVLELFPSPLETLGWCQHQCKHWFGICDKLMLQLLHVHNFFSKSYKDIYMEQISV